MALSNLSEHNAFKVHTRVSIRLHRSFIAEYHSTASWSIHPEMDTTRCLSNHQWKVIFIFSIVFRPAPYGCTPDSFTLFLSPAVLRGISVVSNFLLLRIVESHGTFQSMEVHILPTHRLGRGWVVSFVPVLGFFLNENRILPKAFCPPNRHPGVVTSHFICLYTVIKLDHVSPK